MTICYTIGNRIYINLTNRCNNACTFCIRNNEKGVAGYDLWLTAEPTAQDVIADLQRFDLEACEEVVFCGYGEPTLSLPVLVDVVRYLKKSSHVPVRINTNGLANLYYNDDITPKFFGLIDTVSISLNAKNAREYNELCRPEYGEAAFEGVLSFARQCKRYVPRVVLTVVDVLPPEDIEACGKIAAELGVSFRVRKEERS